MESTWLRDLVFSSNLLEDDAWANLRYLLSCNVNGSQEQKETLSKLLLHFEEQKIAKEAFLEDLVRYMGYKSVGLLFLDLYNVMELARSSRLKTENVLPQLGGTNEAAERKIEIPAESNGSNQALQRKSELLSGSNEPRKAAGRKRGIPSQSSVAKDEEEREPETPSLSTRAKATRGRKRKIPCAQAIEANDMTERERKIASEPDGKKKTRKKKLPSVSNGEKVPEERKVELASEPNGDKGQAPRRRRRLLG